MARVPTVTDGVGRVKNVGDKAVPIEKKLANLPMYSDTNQKRLKHQYEKHRPTGLGCGYDFNLYGTLGS